MSWGFKSLFFLALLGAFSRPLFANNAENQVRFGLEMEFTGETLSRLLTVMRLRSDLTEAEKRSLQIKIEYYFKGVKNGENRKKILDEYLNDPKALTEELRTKLDVGPEPSFVGFETKPIEIAKPKDKIKSITIDPENLMADVNKQDNVFVKK